MLCTPNLLFAPPTAHLPPLSFSLPPVFLLLNKFPRINCEKNSKRVGHSRGPGKLTYWCKALSLGSDERSSCIRGSSSVQLVVRRSCWTMSCRWGYLILPWLNEPDSSDMWCGI
ncbi:hypothetical protein BP00DRAFT_426150 [Aspergillus indologenus CBS 114.80]|uniref:Uncharacterized protein n=1 Tax=Aspergillus indologenus CBS 114.80 TaxID=1450541 RepID=A0A2V5I1V1_9EURO|nr:hypothetical protein BP00DRAFT_426150 [Aspergillus indologenus CBS 114.80]